MRKPGDQVGRYVILSLLGQGGMGEVYEAEDSLLGRKVALKLVPASDASDDARQRMLREARAAAAFEHPNAVLVLDAGVVDGPDGGETFLAMELVRGRTLRAAMNDETIDDARKIRWLCEAGRALGAAHARGLVHRDIKPDNLMIRDDGTLKVLDFGIAKRTAAAVDPSAPTEAGQSLETLTGAGQVVGTPRYASPEQLRGDPLDGRSDQFSWAITAFELLARRPPFDATDAVTLISQILGKPAPALRDIARSVPRDVERVVLRALSKEPSERFASIDDAVDLLEPYAEARTGPADNPTEKTSALSAIPPRTRRAISRTARFAVYGAAAFGGLVIVLLVVAGLTGNLRFDVGARSSASAAVAAAPAADRSKLACGPAKIEGKIPEGVDVAAALGVGACARLGMETGADWRSGPAEPGAAVVEVTAVLGSPNRVTVRVGADEASAEDATPLGAARKAARALADKLEPLACEEAQRRAWGAPDAATARRIESTFRRLVMNDLDDSLSEIRDLEAAVPDSAWPHAMVVFSEAPGTPRHKAAMERALALAPRLPQARAKGLAGVLNMYRGDEHRPEALRLLRQAYNEEPTDADIAGLYAAVAIASGAEEEGFAVVDRIARESPGLAIVPLRNAILAPRRTDPARNARYLARLIEILPEDAGSRHAFFDALTRGDFARAREVVRFRETILAGEDVDFETARLALVTGRLDDGVALAKKRLASGQSLVRLQAALLVASGHFLAGHLEQAHASSLTELQRLRDEGNVLATRNQVFAELRARRRAGEAVPSEIIDAAGDPLAGGEVSVPAKLALAVEVELHRSGKDRRKADAALERLTQAAQLARREDQPSALLALLPLVRLAKGDAAAVELWRNAKDVSESPLTSVALDAALALEATGAPEAEVVAAYRLSMDPFRVETRPLDYLFSALRLASKYPKAVEGEERVSALTSANSTLPAALRDRALALE